ncbi:sarcinarray family MAST domain-containing protein [Methanosarcina hadiensis]|uniref:sarcinarray family MAST domain-containing protein n=1 Tax=Methanosarcina hadiensis TaxID=3078083 RepID=UPI0039778364
MRIKLILFGIFCIILLTDSAFAGSSYGKMDVYYNGEILPGKEIAKPVLKIDEPFAVGINLTVYQKSEVSIELSEIGEGYFKITNGPTSKMNVYRADIMEENSTILYEWTVAPTDKWAGGSIPIDIVYQINDFKTGDILVNGGFTVAYCTISNEYYKGEIPTSEKQPVSETESSPTSASTPAFTFIGAISVLALVFALIRR